MGDEGLPPILRVTIDTDRPVLARQAGRIFDRLAIAYDQWQRRENPGSGRRAELRLAKLHVGSLIADLISVADAAAKLYEHRDLVGGFVAQLGEVLAYIRVRDVARVTPTERKAIEALAAPIANDNARQVTIQVHGDNATIITINGDVVSDLDRFAELLRQRQGQVVAAAGAAAGTAQAVAQGDTLASTIQIFPPTVTQGPATEAVVPAPHNNTGDMRPLPSADEAVAAAREEAEPYRSRDDRWLRATFHRSGHKWHASVEDTNHRDILASFNGKLIEPVEGRLYAVLGHVRSRINPPSEFKLMVSEIREID